MIPFRDRVEGGGGGGGGGDPTRDGTGNREALLRGFLEVTGGLLLSSCTRWLFSSDEASQCSSGSSAMSGTLGCNANRGAEGDRG